MENKQTVLIVDDEVDVCVLMRRVLSKRFLHVECVHSLEDGVSIAASLKPDIVLLDNNLADGYGIDHIQDFKNSTKPVRVVMFSAMDIRKEAMDAGADGFIGKPVDMLALSGL